MKAVKKHNRNFKKYDGRRNYNTRKPINMVYKTKKTKTNFQELKTQFQLRKLNQKTDKTPIVNVTYNDSYHILDDYTSYMRSPLSILSNLPVSINKRENEPFSNSSNPFKTMVIFMLMLAFSLTESSYLSSKDDLEK